MTNAFIKAQFMEPPGSGTSAAPIGAVKAGSGITIEADGTISTSAGGGTVSNIVPSNGIQGGGTGPTVFLGLLPPAGTKLGGVKTVNGSGLSIDADGVIRVSLSTSISGGPGIQVTDLGGSSYSIAATPATNAVLGSVIVSGGANGLRVASSGLLTLAPASPSVLGGIIPGVNCTVAPDGTLNVAGGGTITGVGAGTGLGGGGVAGAVSLFLKPPTPTTIGGVYAGDNVTIAADGKISISANSGVQTLSVLPGTGLANTGTETNPVLRGVLSTTTSSGVVILSDSVDGVVDPTGYAATPLAVKTVADVADAALPKTGGAMSGVITFTGGQPFPGTIPSGSFTQLGGILVGDNSPPGYAQLPLGADGLVLTANAAAPLGVEWIAAGTGTVTSVSGTSPIQVATGTTTPVISVSAASDTAAGVVQLEADPTSTSTTTAPSSFALSVVNQVALNCLPKAGGAMTGNITFAPTQTFPGALPLDGGTMTGDITFAGTQTFPGVLAQGALSGAGAITVGGTLINPILTVNTATTSQLGVVQPDGTTITVDGNGVISAATGSGSLPLSGGTMTGNITFAGTQTFPGVLPLSGGTLTGNLTFNAGQTFPGTVSSSLLDVTGDIVYASGPNTPASLPIGNAGTILAVNAGLPAWRTTTQLGLLTSSAAASTYATINSPTLTGPVTVNTGGGPGANAMTISGGNLVLSTAYTPSSSSSTGSPGEIAWDDTGYLYFCYLPNTWGRIQIDLTPF